MQPGLQDPAPLAALDQTIIQESQGLQAELSTGVNTQADAVPLTALLRDITEIQGINYLVTSDVLTRQIAGPAQVTAYFDRPRLILTSSQLDPTSSNPNPPLTFAIDLRRDTIRAVARPGQATEAIYDFNLARGLIDNGLEGDALGTPPPDQTGGVPQPVRAYTTIDIFNAAQSQGIGLVTITPGTLPLLDTLQISADAKAQITVAVSQGDVVTVPQSEVKLDTITTVGWYQTDPVTGETVGVTEDGGHQGIQEWGAVIGIVAVVLFLAKDNIAYLFGNIKGQFYVAEYKLIAWFVANNYPTIDARQAILDQITDEKRVDLNALNWFGKAYRNGFNAAVKQLNLQDPPAGNLLLTPTPPPPLPSLLPNVLAANAAVGASVVAGAVSGVRPATLLNVSGALAPSWSSTADTSLEASSLSSADATVVDAAGRRVGSGVLATIGLSLTPVRVFGSLGLSMTGSGSLSFYGPAESSLGVSGDWQDYTAVITGSVSMTLSVPAGALSLNGEALPAGVYTISSNSATLSGSGNISSPSFAGSVSITSTSGTINLGPGGGSLAVAGKPLNPDDEATLDGYNGTISVSANGDGADSVTLNGNAGNVLQVATTPTTLTTDQNTPITFAANIQTSLADTYNLTANAPTGWTVSIDSSGNVTVTPAPGLQSGTYPIQIIAQSQTDSNVVAQTTVDVTITPTQPGINFSVASDPEFTVPYDDANLPTAFRASIQNLGPAADTYNLTFSNVPSGFSIVSSETSDTVPAGDTGIVGVYLIPNAGQPLPAPGAQLSFTVTATSTTNPSITQTQPETFTVPNIDAVTVTAGPTAVSTIPGDGVTDTLTITDVGNVAENNITFTDTLSSGLTLTGLAPASLAVGQSTTETITLTPDSSTPLNSTLQATITATFGPAASPQTQAISIPITVAAPGAAAIASAATAANTLGNTNLANQLGDLSTALTNLVQNPTSAVYQSQALASLTAVNGLLGADPYLAALVPTLKSDASTLAQATTAAAVQSAVTTLGNGLDTVGTTLSDEASYNFTLAFVSGNSQVAQPQVPATFQFTLQNTGSQTATYNLGLSGLPAGVTGSLSSSSVTLSPGQSTGSGGIPALTAILTSTSTTSLAPFGFNLTAAAQEAPEITQSITGSMTARTATVQVISVTPNPAFTNPGGTVDVQTQILNAVNQQQQAEVSYTVTDSTGNVLFTSQPVQTTLNVLATLTTVDLGNLDTTGFALGADTITVTVDDASGTAIPGATGTGSILIGTPVTATLATSPGTLPSGSGTVTATLDLGSQASYSSPFTLAGLTAISGSACVAVDGNIAYVGKSGAIDIVDISNPSAPSVVSTFGSSDFPGMSVVALQVYNDELVALVQSGGLNSQSLLVYSLASPSSPALLGQTPLTFQGNNDSRLFAMSISDNHVYTSSAWYRYYGGGQIFEQFGESIDIDITNPAAPTVVDTIYNDPPDSSTGYPDGTSNTWQIAAASDNVLLIGSTTATGSTVSGSSVSGIVMVEDTSNPSSPSLLEDLTIPGMAAVVGISVNGNQAFLIGTSQYWTETGGAIGFGGDIVVATLDLSNPQSPTIVSTQTLNQSSAVMGFVESLGNNLYASVGATGPDGTPEILVFDDSNPQNVSVTGVSVVSNIGPAACAASGNFFFATDGLSLSLYSIGQTSNTPVTAQVTIPANDGVSIVPGSFSLAPTSTTTSADGSQTLEWNLAFSAGSTSQAITWQEAVTGLQPGQSAVVTQDASVQFTSNGTPGTLPLPDQFVAGEQIIGLSPATQTVAPGEPTSYSVNLSNPSSSAVTYTLSVQGLPASWVDLSSTTVNLAAGGTVGVPLSVASDPFAATGDNGFAVTVSGNNGASSSVQGDLVLQGQPAALDSNSYGVVPALSPASATAGQGTSAQYVLQLTNTGSSDDTFSLAATGLPSGVTATFGETTIDVPPGVSNFRDVSLSLTVAPEPRPATIPSPSPPV